MRCPSAILLLFLPGVMLWAQEERAPASDLSAQTSAFEPDGNAVTFTGNARLTDGRNLLQADVIRYNYETGVASARGNVRMTRGEDRLLADSVEYFREDRTFTAQNVRLGRYPYYVAGSEARGNEASITVQDASFSVGEPGPFQPMVTAATLAYRSEDRWVDADQANLGIGSVRPLSLDRFSHSIDIPLISYLSLNGGYRGSLGAYLETALHVPQTPGFKFGGTVGLYSARGIMFGPSGFYASESGGLRVEGDLRSGYINDHGNKLTDVLGDRVPEDRGFLQWRHAQDLTEQLNVSAQINLWSDSEILRDFKPRYFYPVQDPDNYVQAVHTGANHHATVFTRLQPNDFQNVEQRLPEVRLDLLPVGLGGGVFGRAGAGIAFLREEPPGGGPVLRSDRLDAHVALTRPVSEGDWFSFAPVLGGRVTHYARAMGARDDYTRWLGEIGFDSAIRSSAVFDYQNETWKIDGIRHLLTPRLSYRLVPDADQGRPFIPLIDRRSFNTYLPPLGLGDRRNLDDLPPTHLVRVGVDNTWQTRDPVYGSRDLLRLDLALDFHLERAAGQRRTSDLHAALALTPAPWLEFHLYQRVAPQDVTLEELNLGLTLRDGEAWSLRFDSHFLRREIDEYFAEYEMRMNEIYSAVARLRYDSRTSRFNEQALGLRQNLGNIWRIQYLLTMYDGPRRESDFGFSVSVDALGF
ncbi:MAG: LPS-assembly protein LptD [Opitutaceae bacterium]|nr:LPS-assembly protein LptD [Opitutaceae bacterium]